MSGENVLVSLDEEMTEGCLSAFFDFGCVVNDSVSTKTITIANAGTITQLYELSRDPETNPLDYAFQCTPYSSDPVEPGGTFSILLEYHPLVPFTATYDYFNLASTFGVCFKFGVKGRSVGPSVFASKKELFFLSIGLLIPASQTIELTNPSAVMASFQFDIDESCNFDIEPLCGNIKPHQKVKIHFTYIPKRPGILYRQIFCLLHQQGPIAFDISALATFDENFKLKNITTSNFPFPVIEDDYGRYVKEYLGHVNNPAPLTFSRTNIDFGYQNIDEKDKSNPETLSVTNNLEKSFITIQWEKDPRDIFTVHPETVTIAACSSSMFEIIFEPYEKNRAYSITMSCTVHWDEKTTHDSLDITEEKDVSVPFMLDAVRVLGHTFVHREDVQQPLYEILPPVIHIPPAIPGVPAHTTCILKKCSNKPLMFKFIPPDRTNYRLKPMNGIITQDFQIVVVTLVSSDTEESAYFERWSIEVDGVQDNHFILDMKAYVEFPKLVVGDKNTVFFPPTFPNTECAMEVLLKNPTRHTIRYFLEADGSEKLITFSETEGMVAANELLFSTWTFVPPTSGIHSLEVRCSTQALKDCCVRMYPAITGTVSVYGESETVDLVALPNEFDCGVVSCEEKRSISFHVFNFSRCQLHIGLQCYLQEDNSDFSQGDVVIQPNVLSIGGDEKIEIDVTICPSLPGTVNLNLGYVIYRSGDKSAAVSPSPVDLLIIRYDAMLSQLQVVDLNYIGGGPIFSKLFMWRVLSINRLNEALSCTVAPKTKSAAVIYMPHALLNSVPLTVFFLVKNVSAMKCDWKLKFKYSCTCTVVEDTMSRRSYKKECTHRDQIKFMPMSGELEPYEETPLMMVVKYNILGINKTHCSLLLSNKREVKLSILVLTLAFNSSTPSTCINSLTFMGTYIGDEYPGYQAYWLYNNALKPVTYSVDTSSLASYTFNNACDCDIISCLNPSGVLQPKTSYPVLFKFRPKALEAYSADIRIRLGRKWFKIEAYGDGALIYQNHGHKMRHKAPSVTSFDMLEIPVYLSVDHIVFDPFPTHSKRKKIFFMENRTENIQMKFKWSKVELPEFLSCYVEPAEGIVEPCKTQACTATVVSYARPCLLTVQVSCEIINMNVEKQHSNILDLQNNLKRKLEEEFLITEEGEVVPEVKVPPIPPPPSMYRVLAVTCNTICMLNIDERLSFKEQMKLFPSRELPVRQEGTPKIAFSTETDKIDMVKHVLDVLIWDILRSERFSHGIEAMKEESSPYYCQFVMNPEQEKKEVEKTQHILPQNLLDSVLYDIIDDIFNEEYGFDAQYEGKPEGDEEENNSNPSYSGSMLSSRIWVEPQGKIVLDGI